MKFLKILLLLCCIVIASEKNYDCERKAIVINSGCIESKWNTECYTVVRFLEGLLKDCVVMANGAQVQVKGDTVTIYPYSTYPCDYSDENWKIK